jgi:anti-sigma B factor antagonist
MSDASNREISDGTLAIKVLQNGTDHTLVLAGELDLANAEALSGALEAAEAAETSRVVVDMTALEFIDSTGIAVLVAAHRRMNENSDDLRLRFVPSKAVAVQRVMTLTGLDDAMPFVPAGD